MAVHAIGDAAVDRVLGLYRGLEGVREARHRVRGGFTAKTSTCLSPFVISIFLFFNFIYGNGWGLLFTFFRGEEVRFLWLKRMSNQPQNNHNLQACESRSPKWQSIFGAFGSIFHNQSNLEKVDGGGGGGH